METWIWILLVLVTIVAICLVSFLYAFFKYGGKISKNKSGIVHVQLPWFIYSLFSLLQGVISIVFNDIIPYRYGIPLSQWCDKKSTPEEIRSLRDRRILEIKSRILENYPETFEEIDLVQLFDTLPPVTDKDSLQGKVFHNRSISIKGLSSRSWYEYVIEKLQARGIHLHRGFTMSEYEADSILLNILDLVLLPLPIFGNIRLQNEQFRGKLSYSIGYDHQPWRDHMRLLDDKTILVFSTIRGFGIGFYKLSLRSDLDVRIASSSSLKKRASDNVSTSSQKLLLAKNEDTTTKTTTTTTSSAISTKLVNVSSQIVSSTKSVVTSTSKTLMSHVLSSTSNFKLLTTPSPNLNLNPIEASEVVISSSSSTIPKEQEPEVVSPIIPIALSFDEQEKKTPMNMFENQEQVTEENFVVNSPSEDAITPRLSEVASSSTPRLSLLSAESVINQKQSTTGSQAGEEDDDESLRVVNGDVDVNEKRREAPSSPSSVRTLFPAPAQPTRTMHRSYWTANVGY